MQEIIKRLMENRQIRLDELAVKQSDAIEKCSSLGKQFIEHFHKVYIGGLEDRDFRHHCHEMQTWYDSVSSIVMKRNNKYITNSELNDWFFTVCSSVDHFLHDEDEISAYEVFMKKLDRGDSVEELLTSILEASK